MLVEASRVYAECYRAGQSSCRCFCSVLVWSGREAAGKACSWKSQKLGLGFRAQPLTIMSSFLILTGGDISLACEIAAPPKLHQPSLPVLEFGKHLVWSCLTCNRFVQLSRVMCP